MVHVQMQQKFREGASIVYIGSQWPPAISGAASRLHISSKLGSKPDKPLKLETCQQEVVSPVDSPAFSPLRHSFRADTKPLTRNACDPTSRCEVALSGGNVTEQGW